MTMPTDDSMLEELNRNVIRKKALGHKRVTATDGRLSTTTRAWFSDDTCVV